MYDSDFSTELQILQAKERIHSLVDQLVSTAHSKIEASADFARDTADRSYRRATKELGIYERAILDDLQTLCPRVTLKRFPPGTIINRA